MNAGKSVKIALAYREQNITWLSVELDISHANASRIANSKALSQKAIERLAIVFDMKASEFIALGE